MKHSLLFATASLTLVLTGLCAWRVIKDASARRHARILYIENGSEWGMLVNGDGRLSVQKREVSTTGLLPTCTTTVDEIEVNDLFRLMVDKHFESLPQRGFPNYVGAIESFPWKLHIITVDAGSIHGEWVFETGEVNGRVESISPNFAAVEEYLRELRRKAIPSDGTPCALGPDIAISTTAS